MDVQSLGDERLLKVAEVALLLSLSKQTIYRMIYEKQIPHVKLRGAVRFQREEILEWLKKRSH